MPHTKCLVILEVFVIFADFFYFLLNLVSNYLYRTKKGS